MTLRLCLVCLLLLSTPLFSGSAPPFEETLDLTLVTLNRLSFEPERERVAGLLPAKPKALPASVRPYLRPTGQMDLYSSAVGRAAARIRRAVAPRLRDKDALRDSPAVARAVGLWLDTHVAADPGRDSDARPCLDWRLAYPKVSALIRQGHADADGRALVAVALLRALRVPARIAFARGGLTAQYWVAARAPRRVPARRRSRRAPRGPRPPLGWWAVLDPDIRDSEIDAWSLDPASLDCLRWTPRQELSVSLAGWERAAFAQDESAAARAAFDASLAAGTLTLTAGSRPLSATADAVLQSLGSGRATVWVLTAQHWRLRSEGAMQGMSSVQILTPYRPDLRDWGREQRGPLRSSEIVAQGVWSDRPGRLRLHKDLQDEWASPPPALGILHWYDLGVRRQGTVLQAGRRGARVQGVAFRGDNLTPREGWDVRVDGQGTTETAEATVQGDGQFSVALSPALAKDPCLRVVLSARDQESVQQRLLLVNQAGE